MSDDIFTAELYDDGSWCAYRRRDRYEGGSYASGRHHPLIAGLLIGWHTWRERRRPWNPR